MLKVPLNESITAKKKEDKQMIKARVPNMDNLSFVRFTTSTSDIITKIKKVYLNYHFNSLYPVFYKSKVKTECLERVEE